MKIDLEKSLKVVGNYLIMFLGIVVKLILVSVFLAGSVASIILLYKLYPELGIELLGVLLKIFGVFNCIIKIILVIAVIAWVLFIGVMWFNLIKKTREKRARGREKFIDDLAEKLTKRGIKNVQPRPKK